MEIIKNKISKENLYRNKNLPIDSCFLDIETTGFSRNNDIIYLIGILYFDINEKAWVLAQYFSNDLKDEPKMLDEASKFLMNFTSIINYNGNAFDIPFINHKLKKYKIEPLINKDKSLDLYSIIRKNKNLLNLDNLKLKTVEKFLGIHRDDIYSGKDCIEFYKDYILTGDKELKQRLLKHNFDDLYFLVDIIGVLDIIKNKMSFTLERVDRRLEFTISNIKETKDSMTFEGSIIGLEEKIIHYHTNYNVLIQDTNTFNIVLYTNKGMVSPNEKGVFIKRTDLNISKHISSQHRYDLGPDILLLKVESTYLLDEILTLLKEIINNIL